MKKWIIWMGLALFPGLYSCTDDNLNGAVMLDNKFEQTVEGWAAGFAEYSSATDSASLEKAAGRARLPAVLDSTIYGFKIQSHNRSDDMFMYLKRKISGLTPNGNYNVVFDITLGTPYTDKGIGAGGSQGGATYIKAGASNKEPVATLTSGFYSFNLDKGNQSENGKEMVVLGNISNGLEADGYKLVQRSNGGAPVPVTANANGEIWLCVGTDSGFEGLTVLYYDRIRTTIIERTAN
ncbi:hypothetical protein [Dyadobacter psychrotolerans]|uniref:Lipoprotein n=1 Tax=Dyadobacter psychrotolerans TaxID=2541721 RepID=A0A4R5DV60_9BACT|nr:hypothetical protein [Dyadobacter psychrotolerans]TDE16240.1 hypothetical protein E0F88_08300 [Dyadobacter psychrotolerans]